MKPRISNAIFALACILLLSQGCHPSSTVQTAGKTSLPDDIAGTWKARESKWRIVLSPEGTVSSMRIPMCIVDLKPNQATKVKMKHGEFSTFEAGDCEVEYTPAKRELFVKIDMKRIHVAFPDDALEGSSVDRFMGPVSEDGKVWTADWINIFDYGPRFPQDANGIYAEPLLFDKVED